MTWLTRTLTLVITLMVALVQPARASDFSPMADPAFSRIGFLSQQRWLELGCAAYADFASRNGKEVTPAEAQVLHAAVRKRLVIELGSDSWADRILQTRDFADSDDEKASRDAAFAQRAPQCAPLLAALRGGTLEQVLAPIAGSPIALPDIETCLAFDVLAQRLDPPLDENLFNDPGGPEQDMRTLLLGKTGEERSARDQRVRAIAAAMPPLSREDLAMRVSVGCIFPMLTEYRRLDPYGDFADDAGEEPEAASSDEE